MAVLPAIRSFDADEWRRGWRVLVAASAGVGVGSPAVITTAGLFVLPMQHEFGWSRSAIAIGPMIGLIYSVLSPIGGMVIDRLGARPVAIAGLMALTCGLLLLAAVPVAPLPFYGLMLVLGAIGTVTSNVVYCRALATWFNRHAGTAIALTLSGVSAVGAVQQPLLQLVITRCGWRMGYVALAATTAFVGLPLVLRWFRERPSPTGGPRGGTHDGLTGASVSEAVRDRRFWLIIAAFAGAAAPIGGVVNQLPPLLVGRGYDPADAAMLVSVFLLATCAGRLAAGTLFDYTRPPIVAACFLAASALGAMLMFFCRGTSSWPAVAAAVSLLGLAQGAEGDFIAYFTLRIFGLRRFSTLFATVAGASAIAFALGGLGFTAVFDRFGDYQWALFASTAILFGAALIAARIRMPPRAA